MKLADVKTLLKGIAAHDARILPRDPDDQEHKAKVWHKSLQHLDLVVAAGAVDEWARTFNKATDPTFSVAEILAYAKRAGSEQCRPLVHPPDEWGRWSVTCKHCGPNATRYTATESEAYAWKNDHEPGWYIPQPPASRRPPDDLTDYSTQCPTCKAGRGRQCLENGRSRLLNHPDRNPATRRKMRHHAEYELAVSNGQRAVVCECCEVRGPA